MTIKDLEVGDYVGFNNGKTLYKVIKIGKKLLTIKDFWDCDTKIKFIDIATIVKAHNIKLKDNIDLKELI